MLDVVVSSGVKDNPVVVTLFDVVDPVGLRIAADLFNAADVPEWAI